MEGDIVTIWQPDNSGPVSLPEEQFDPAKHTLAKGSRIPATAAVAVGATAASTLQSIAGDPKLADAPGLIPVAFNPPPGNVPAGMTAAPGSTTAQSAAKNADIPAALTGDAAKAHPEQPKAKTADAPVDTGQLFTARVKGGKFAVCNMIGELLSKQTYDTREGAVAAYQQPTTKRH